MPIIINIKGKVTIKTIKKESLVICLLCDFKPLETKIGIPITKVKSKIFAPIILPKEIAGVLLNAEFIPTNSSGRDVPIPNKIKPVTNSLNFRNLVIVLRLFKSHNELIKRPINDIAKKRMFVNAIIKIKSGINVFISFYYTNFKTKAEALQHAIKDILEMLKEMRVEQLEGVIKNSGKQRERNN